MVFLEAHVLTRPEIFVGLAQNKFDDKLEIKDQPTIDFVKQQLAAFDKYIRKVTPARRAGTLRPVHKARRGPVRPGPAVWSWLPSFLNQVQGIAPAQAGMRQHLWCWLARSSAWSGAPCRNTTVTDEIHGARAFVCREVSRPGVRIRCTAIRARVVRARRPIRAHRPRWIPTICTVRSVSAIVIDVIHPGVRAMFRTGAVPGSVRPRPRAVHCWDIV
jgi:MFS transporter, Spinster family, sphingosine-1-phosphate transporter